MSEDIEAFVVDGWDPLSTVEGIDGQKIIAVALRDHHGNVCPVVFPLEALRALLPELQQSVDVADVMKNPIRRPLLVPITARHTSVGRSTLDNDIHLLFEVSDAVTYATALAPKSAVEIRDGLTRAIDSNIQGGSDTRN